MPNESHARVAGRYRLEAVLARGGNGIVYRAFDEVTDRRIAVKRLVATNDASRHLFEREYHTLVGIRHPRIIEVFDYGVDGGPYYTMELLGGQDLRELAPLSFHGACKHLRDIASSLALLHTRGLLHRDLSVRNVRVDGLGRCKVLDFGSLCTFGTCTELVGTPTGVPPEAFYRLPLDQRADLYGLGALGYYLLTGVHAYPAKRVHELPEVWKNPPLPPSSFDRDIPRLLDNLILSLLSHDPADRPPDAGEVSRRLGRIACLPPDADVQLARAYVRNPRLVGRAEETARMEDQIARAMAGEGNVVWLEGAMGVGKTRFLEELHVTAKVRGASVAHVDAEATGGAAGVAEAVVRRLFDESPEIAEESAKPFAEVLAQLSRVMSERLRATTGATPRSVGERRALLSAALFDWTSAFCSKQPAAIMIDNVHASDQISTAYLLRLAEHAQSLPLWIIVTRRTGDSWKDPKTLRSLSARAEICQLFELLPQEITELVASMFGPVPYHRRFARWMDEITAGNPLYCVELASQAVDRGLARYDDGGWTLSDNLPSARELASAEAAFRSVLGRVSEQARAFAELLSLKATPTPIGLCVALWDGAGRSSIHDVLGELVDQGILVGNDNTYSFRQKALKNILENGLDETARRECHRRIGRAILALGSSEHAIVLEAGWHLLRGGEVVRGADLLARLAEQSLVAEAVDNDLHAIVPALEAALEVYQSQGRHPLEQASLLRALVEAGFYSDRRVAEKYAQRSVEVLSRAVGLDVAGRLRPKIGKVASLTAGLASARLRFACASRGRKTGAFQELLIDLLTTVTYLCGVATVCLDPARAAEYAKVIEPFDVIGSRHAPAGVYDFCSCLVAMTRDRPVEARQGWLNLVERLKDPHAYPGLPLEDRRLFLGGAWYALGVLETLRDSPAVLTYAKKLENLGLRFYEIVAARLRLSYHLYRGEFEQASEYRRQVEVLASQVGSAWQVDVWDPVAAMAAYAHAGDVVALRHCADRLARLAAEIPSLEIQARFAEGLYRLSVGEPERTIAIYEAALAESPPRERIGWTTAHGQLASAYNAAGRHSEARATCLRALAELSDQDRDFVMMTLEIEIELSVAEVEIDDAGKAAARLDALIARYGHDRGPMQLGRLYGARAYVAHRSGFDDTAMQWLARMERTVKATGNAALVAKWKRARSRILRIEPPVQKIQPRPLQPYRPERLTLRGLRFAVPRRPMDEGVGVLTDALNDEEDFTATEGDGSVTSSA